MKDKNGIEKKCSNCRYYEVCASNEVCEKYTITIKAYEARIAVLKEESALLKELRFTDEEIDFIKKAISMAILDCETNPSKPSDEKINLMWSIKSKCDAIFERKG